MVVAEDSTCWSCLSNTGVRRISPGPTIHEGKYWYVEHAYPCGLKGWLVIVLKRHSEALHNLLPEEFAELGEIQARACYLLYVLLKCEKEYIMCVAEAEHFTHIHFHIVPKPHGLPNALKATKIYTLLKVTEEQAVPREEVKEFCEMFRSCWETER